MSKEIMQHCFMEVYVNVNDITNSEYAAKDIKKRLEKIATNTSYIQNVQVETEYVRLTVGNGEIRINYSYDVPATFHKGYPNTSEYPGQLDYFDMYTYDDAKSDTLYDIKHAIGNAGFELVDIEVIDFNIEDENDLMDKLIEAEEVSNQDHIDHIINERLNK